MVRQVVSRIVAEGQCELVCGAELDAIGEGHRREREERERERERGQVCKLLKSDFSNLQT